MPAEVALNLRAHVLVELPEGGRQAPAIDQQKYRGQDFQELALDRRGQGEPRRQPDEVRVGKQDDHVVLYPAAKPQPDGCEGSEKHKRGTAAVVGGKIIVENVVDVGFVLEVDLLNGRWRVPAEEGLAPADLFHGDKETTQCCQTKHRGAEAKAGLVVMHSDLPGTTCQNGQNKATHEKS